MGVKKEKKERKKRKKKQTYKQENAGKILTVNDIKKEEYFCRKRRKTSMSLKTSRTHACQFHLNMYICKSKTDTCSWKCNYSSNQQFLG